jgi:hypothetical protein
LSYWWGTGYAKKFANTSRCPVQRKKSNKKDQQNNQDSDNDASNSSAVIDLIKTLNLVEQKLVLASAQVVSGFKGGHAKILP